MKTILIISALCISLLLSIGLTRGQAQSVIVGRVLDASTNKPVPFATVYINASTRGTTADGDGNYQLTGVKAGTVEIVASSVGFRASRQTIRHSDSKPSRVGFALTPDANALQTVTVTAKRSKAFDRMLRQFKRELLGNTSFAEKCLITNITAVSLTMDEGTLKAQASEPLVIENNALGYRLYYDMNRFDSFRQITHYAGTSRFEVMKASNNEQAERWEQNRQKAYQGSIRHLIASLIAGTYEKEGFLVYKAGFNAPVDLFIPIKQLVGERPAESAKPDSLFKPAQLASERQLFSNRPLEIFYTRQLVLSSPYKEMPYAYSMVYMPKGKAAIVTTDGWIVEPNGLEVRGVMSDDRLSTLLPLDWQPGKPASTSLTAPPDEGTVLPADTLITAIGNRFSDGQKETVPAVFLHIDKGLYATGDQVWFSGYVIDPTTHQPFVQPVAEGENPVHIELIAPNGRQIQHQWARMKEGRTSGSFRLSDSLTTGVYRLRAYADADAGNNRPAFERTISIVNGLNLSTGVKSVESVTVSDSLDVQFLPEGGHWVAGLPARMGIKAANQQGRGIAVAGRIRSKQGAELGRFTTNHLGIGSVQLMPLPNQTYVADVNTAAGHTEMKLPAVDSSGLVLMTDMVTDSTQLLVRIQASAQLASQPVYLIVQSRGKVIQQTKLQLLKGKARLSIPAAKLPVGVAQVTLFNAQGIPQAERLVFVPERALPIQAEVTTDKPAYQPRESVTVSLRVADGFGEPLSIVGSASVTDAGQLPADTTVADIRTHLLLTGELRGRVEQPNSYFVRTGISGRRALDDLLLTQGWRRINWQFTPTKRPASAPAAVGIRLTGRVLDKKGSPIPAVNVLLTFMARTGVDFARSARTDQEGRFMIDNLVLADTVTVGSRVMNATFKPVSSAHVVLDAPGDYFHSEDSLSSVDITGLNPFLSAIQQRQATSPDQYRDRNARQLQEVVVRAAKPDDDSRARRISLHGTPDATILFDEKSRSFSNLYDMLAGRVSGVQVTSRTTLGEGGYSVIVRGVNTISKTGYNPPLYIVDGMYVSENADGNALFMFNANQIERIEVIKNGGTVAYGARGGAGVIAFFSKRPGNKTVTGNSSEPALTLYGYPSEREFYTPRYGNSADENAAQPDRRDVLYWKPILLTDGRGLTTFRFPLSDSARTVRITVQGITTYGRPVYISRVLQLR